MNGKIMVHTIYGEGSKFTCMIDQRISTERVKTRTKKLDTSIDLEDSYDEDEIIRMNERNHLKNQNINSK